MIIQRAGARLLIRYVATVLVSWGVFSQGDVRVIVTDPDLEQIVAVALGSAAIAVVEWAYRKAKKLGLTT